MNILIDKFPHSVAIGGVEYIVNDDFRSCLKIMLAFEDKELTDWEKRLIMLERIYPVIPDDMLGAIEAAVLFLDGGKKRAQSDEEADRARYYSFSKDAEYIYGAIRQTYGVDLESIQYMHWWKFLNLFIGLSGDCFFNRLVYYRKRKAEGKLTKDEEAYCDEIADILELDQVVSSAEAIELDDFYSQLNC